MSRAKYAILGDIHANLEGLQAVLADAESLGISQFVCVGDIVGYNANPAECLEIVREKCCGTVRGNHDYYCSENEPLDDFQPLAAEVIAWTRRQLTEEQKEYLRRLRMVQMIENFTIVHSTLDMPDQWAYVLEKFDANANFNYQTTTVCFYGHTHVPICFEKAGDTTGGPYSTVPIKIGKKYFVNVGSVGQPRDGDPRSAYVIYDVDKRTIELRRLEYDVEETQRKIRAAGLPERVAARLAHGR